MCAWSGVYHESIPCPCGFLLLGVFGAPLWCLQHPSGFGGTLECQFQSKRGSSRQPVYRNKFFETHPHIPRIRPTGCHHLQIRTSLHAHLGSGRCEFEIPPIIVKLDITFVADILRLHWQPSGSVSFYKSQTPKFRCTWARIPWQPCMPSSGNLPSPEHIGAGHL